MSETAVMRDNIEATLAQKHRDYYFVLQQSQQGADITVTTTVSFANFSGGSSQASGSGRVVSDIVCTAKTRDGDIIGWGNFSQSLGGKGAYFSPGKCATLAARQLNDRVLKPAPTPKP